MLLIESNSGAKSAITLIESNNKRMMQLIDCISAADVTPAVVNDSITQVKSILSDNRQMLHTLQRSAYSNLPSIKQDIINNLNKQNQAYYWAVNMYDPATLNTYDVVTREFIKSILRDYFSPQGMEYDGWLAGGVNESE